jgi:uncharacterized protein (DUF736 family)
MTVIGTFVPTKDGGWIGDVHTLTIRAKLRFVPNDNRVADNAPMFHVFIGRTHVGDAWPAHSHGDPAKDHLRVRLDDPTLSAPLSAAFSRSEDTMRAQLLWRRPQTDGTS